LIAQGIEGAIGCAVIWNLRTLEPASVEGAKEIILWANRGVAMSCI